MSEQGKLPAAAYIVGGLSFIPAIGFIFGVISLVWGLATKQQGRKTLMLLGIGGISFTVIIYGALFYYGFAKRGGQFDEMRVELAKGMLSTAVQTIEFYKAQNGHYPESMEVLAKSLPQDSQAFLALHDSTEISFSKQPRYFYYQLADPNHYYLLGVGPDRQPFTADDLLPQVKIEPGSNVGLIFKQPAQ